jgi:flavodoxin
MNTERIAKAMTEVMGAELVKVGEILPEKLIEYELIGFSSGKDWPYKKDLKLLTCFLQSCS